MKILAKTGKVSCFAALLLCAGNVQAGEPKYKVDASTFQCITKMTSVKHFFVDNLAGNLAGTVDVAKAGKGQFPEGTMLQLIPNEAMIKQQKGFSPGDERLGVLRPGHRQERHENSQSGSGGGEQLPGAQLLRVP